MRWLAPVPAMGTHRSRGNDSSLADFFPGSIRTTMIVSDRWPPVASLPPLNTE